VLSKTGMLLVATPRLLDPNFYRSVVLILQHDEDGAIGVILNRPTAEPVANHLPDWAERIVSPPVVRFGGPVQPEVAIGLAATADGEETGVPGLSLVDLGSSPRESDTSIVIYSGYSGWSPGQLEMEIDEGSWYVVPAIPDEPFQDPDDLWRSVLRRQGGFLAAVSTFPEDTTLN
jgi:putative transcriptional regulator